MRGCVADRFVFFWFVGGFVEETLLTVVAKLH